MCAISICAQVQSTGQNAVASYIITIYVVHPNRNQRKRYQRNIISHSCWSFCYQEGGEGGKLQNFSNQILCPSVGPIL